MVNPTRFALTCLFIWSIAGLTGWLVPQTQAPARVVGASRTLGLPEPLRIVDLKPAAEALARTDLWGSQLAQTAVADAAQAKPTVETWTRVAIVQEKEGSFVLLSGPDHVIKTFKQGDTLPDGARLLKIQSNQITLLPAGKKRPETRHLD
jgi:hypothetical protein